MCVSQDCQICVHVRFGCAVQYSWPLLILPSRAPIRSFTANNNNSCGASSAPHGPSAIGGSKIFPCLLQPGQAQKVDVLRPSAAEIKVAQRPSLATQQWFSDLRQQPIEFAVPLPAYLASPFAFPFNPVPHSVFRAKFHRHMTQRTE